MTKLKNTKKGMAKKALSISLVAAMLATSNVPVWAAEFSDGSEAVVPTEEAVEVTEFSSGSEADATPVEEATDSDVDLGANYYQTQETQNFTESTTITSDGVNNIWYKTANTNMTLTANVPSSVSDNKSPRKDAFEDNTKKEQTISYQWYKDGNIINGATNQTYTVKKEDVGHAISVKVTDTYQVLIKRTQTSLLLPVYDYTYGNCTDVYENSDSITPVAFSMDQMELTVGSESYMNPSNQITVKYEDLTRGTTLTKVTGNLTKLNTQPTNVTLKGLDRDVTTTNVELTYGVDYFIYLVGDPDANGNQKARIVFQNENDTPWYLYNGEKTFEFNVSEAKGALDNTKASIQTTSGSEWNGQWGTALKAVLDTDLGTVVSYQWQKCEKSEAVNPDYENNWSDIAGANMEKFTPGQDLVKEGVGNDGKDYLIRIKVVYKDNTNEEKTTYSAYAAVLPQNVNADSIILTKANGDVIDVDKDTITADELEKMKVSVKTSTGIQSLTLNTQYEVNGFNEDTTGVQQVSVVLTSPFNGKKIVSVSNKLTNISAAHFTLGKNVYTFNPEGFVPEVSEVVLGNKTLIAGTDYTVSKITPNVTAYEKQPDINGAPNGASVQITGKGVYTGSALSYSDATRVNVVPEDLASKCEVKATGTTIPAGTVITDNNYSEYVKVYYNTSDGRKIELTPTTGTARNFKVENITPNAVAGETATLKVSGPAVSGTDFNADENFYGSLSVNFTVEANDIFSDTTKVPGSDITRGNALLGEIATAITGDVYMVNGSTLTKVALDKTAGTGEVFTGSEITFDGLKSLKHYVADENNTDSGIETLVAGHDYTVTYNNNLHAGKYNNNPAPSITITMKGKYKGERTFYFNIEQRNITINDIVNGSPSVVFNPLATNETAKDVYAPTDKFNLSIKGKTTKLVEGKDYTIDWVRWINNDKDDTSKGYFEVTVKAHQSRNADTGTYFYDGDYTGQDTYTVTVAPKSLTSSDVTFADIESQKWTGSAAKPALTIKDQNGQYTLVEGKDFTTTWKDNVAVGTATVTVTGIDNGNTTGRYKDKLQKTFSISSKSLTDGKIVKDYKTTGTYTASDSVLQNQMYNDGKEVKAKFVVVDSNNNRLVEDRDYTVTYKDNINVGTATITITGKGSYEGTLTTTFKIVGELINGKFDKTVLADQVYTGNEIKPEVTFTPNPLKLEEGKDYEIVYVNNVNSYTATGKEDLDSETYAGPYVAARGIGNYAGEIRLAFNIKAAELTNACATAEDAVYAGGKIAEAKITVKNPVSGKELEAGKDYKVEYKSGVNVGDKGEAVITILDTKNYSVKGNADNTLTVNYNIVAKDLKDVTVNPIEDITYTGSQITPVVTVLNGDVMMVQDTDYTVSYGENKEVGIGTVTITAKGNNYKGTKEVTFNIVEEKPEVGKAMITDVVVKGNVASPVLSGRVDGATGYDFVIATEEDYKNGRVDVSKNILATKTNFYYVQEGTYYAYCHAWKRGEDGKKVFGAWSNLYKFEVTATTPATPKINSVKVSGSTVTVTYTKCADATGYDIVLGTNAKTVRGELRPVNYGTLVKKVTKGNVVTATFKNVPKKTYYAGLHAYNRTSEDGKKVFSKWSNVKKVTVK